MGRLLVPTLCLISGLFQASYVILDVYSAIHITDDAYVLSLASMLLGLPLTFLLLAFFALPPKSPKRVGTLIDPTFHRILLPTQRASLTAFLYTAVAGIIGAISVLIYFWATTFLDPSIISPLMQFVIVYLLLADWLLDKETPEIVEIQSLFMITLGAVLVTFNKGHLDIVSLIIVLFGLNGTSLLMTIFQKKAVSVELDEQGTRVDALNIRTWFVLWMGSFTVLFSLPFMNAQRWHLLANAISRGWYVFSLSMLLAFFSFALYVRALANARMAIVNALLASNVLFTAIFSYLISLVSPDLLGFSTGTDHSLWVVKLIGALLVMTGIVGLSLSEVRLYVFLRVLPGYSLSLIMNDLRAVKGVLSVRSISGTFDMVVRVRIRAIGRARTLLDQRLTKVKGIETTVTFPVLSEWERNT